MVRDSQSPFNVHDVLQSTEFLRLYPPLVADWGKQGGYNPRKTPNLKNFRLRRTSKNLIFGVFRQFQDFVFFFFFLKFFYQRKELADFDIRFALYR